MCMNPLSSKFNLARARQFLDFAIKFTPQYGDSFIEYLRLELLTTGHAINSQLEQVVRTPLPWDLSISLEPSLAVITPIAHAHRLARDFPMMLQQI